MYHKSLTLTSQEVIDDRNSLLKGIRKWQGKAESFGGSVEYKETLGAQILVPEGCVSRRITKHWYVLSRYCIRWDWARRASEYKCGKVLVVYLIVNVNLMESICCFEFLITYIM